jgi:hypothetical protein
MIFLLVLHLLLKTFICVSFIVEDLSFLRNVMYVPLLISYYVCGTLNFLYIMYVPLLVVINVVSSCI